MPRANTSATQSSRRSGRRTAKRSRSTVEAEESGVAEIPTDDECADGQKNVPVDQAAMTRDNAPAEPAPQEAVGSTASDAPDDGNDCAEGSPDTMAVDTAVENDGSLRTEASIDADFGKGVPTATANSHDKGHKRKSRSPSPAREMKDVGSSDYESTLSPDPLPYGDAHIAVCAEPGFKAHVSRALDSIMGNDSASIALGLKEPTAISACDAIDESAAPAKAMDGALPSPERSGQA